MKRVIFAMFMALIVFFPLYAEPTAPDLDERATRGLGISAGFIGGNGFSIRLMPPEKGMGFQAGFIFVSSSGDRFFSMGGELLGVLKRTDSSALYWLAGMGVNASGDDSGIGIGAGLGM